MREELEYLTGDDALDGRGRRRREKESVCSG